MKTSFELFVHYRFWVATMVLALGVFSSRSLGVVPDPRILAILWFSTLAIYNLDHVFDQKETNTRAAKSVATLSLVGLGTTLFSVPWLVASPIVIGFAVILGYLFLPKRSGSMKRALVKPIFIGTAVATAVASLPALLAWSGGGFTAPRALEGFARTVVLGFLCAANSLFCDALDEEHDRNAGESTIAAVANAARARQIATLLAVCVLVATNLAYFVGWTSGFDARPAVTVAALATIAFGWLLPKTTSRAVSGFVLDGALLLPALLAGCLR